MVVNTASWTQKRVTGCFIVHCAQQERIRSEIKAFGAAGGPVLTHKTLMSSETLHGQEM